MVLQLLFTRSYYPGQRTEVFLLFHLHIGNNTSYLKKHSALKTTTPQGVGAHIQGRTCPPEAIENWERLDVEAGVLIPVHLVSPVLRRCLSGCDDAETCPSGEQSPEPIAFQLPL